MPNFVNHIEAAGQSTATLGHDEPLVEARGCAKRRERDGILVCGTLVERGEQKKRENTRSFPRES
ncbi:MAG: hypothetical protein ABJF95_00720, partial [Marinobacter sp.]|uniref:hypothetical protein n=1 Tax=Marinobacter sp. TaxID=50741 RepID=UPI003262DF8F